MIVVPARKEKDAVRIASIMPCTAFRPTNSSELFFKAHDGRVVSLEHGGFFDATEWWVIPARVILVEMGADLKDVAEALEKL